MNEFTVQINSIPWDQNDRSYYNSNLNDHNCYKYYNNARINFYDNYYGNTNNNYSINQLP